MPPAPKLSRARSDLGGLEFMAFSMLDIITIGLAIPQSYSIIRRRRKFVKFVKKSLSLLQSLSSLPSRSCYF